MSLTAVIVSYNSAHVLPECLAALHAASVSTLVVDNASTDASAAVATRAGAQVIVTPENLGFGRAMNLGVAAASTPMCLLLNPDAILTPGAADALKDAATQHPDAAVIGPQLVEPDGRVFYQPRSYLAHYLENPKGLRHLPEGEVCVPFVSGACMLVRRDVFLALGGFDPQLFLFYEDDDLCRRVYDAGYGVLYAPAAVVHHGRGTSSATPNRYRARYHLAWSKCYVARKYGLPSPALRLLIPQFFKALLALLRCRRTTFERHAGSIAGAWDFMKGRRR